MSDQKLITITKDELADIRNGNAKRFVENMIKIGVSINRSGHEVTTIRGPFDNVHDDESLFIVNLKKATIEPDNQAARS